MAEISIYVRKLEKLAVSMDIPVEKGGANEEEEVDTSQMTAYEKQRYFVTKTMASVRTDLAELDAMDRGGGSNVTKRAALSNRVRKNVREMKSEVAKLKQDAKAEGKLTEYDEVIKHMKRTDRLYAQRYRAKDPDQEEGSSFDGGSGGGIPMKTIDQLDSGDLSEGLLDPTQDEEFQQFFLETKKKDQQIEEGLHRVHGGVLRIKEQAQLAADELALQNKMLDTAIDKADKRTEEMQSVNKKLKETLKEVEKDKYCCYLICLLLVLGILGVLVSQLGLV